MKNCGIFLWGTHPNCFSFFHVKNVVVKFLFGVNICWGSKWGGGCRVLACADMLARTPFSKTIWGGGGGVPVCADTPEKQTQERGSPLACASIPMHSLTNQWVMSLLVIVLICTHAYSVQSVQISSSNTHCLKSGLNLKCCNKHHFPQITNLQNQVKFQTVKPFKCLPYSLLFLWIILKSSLVKFIKKKDWK